jgi:hypothetical protein
LKKFLQQLNGWQRLFVVWLVLIQAPVSVLTAVEIENSVQPLLPKKIEQNLKTMLNERNIAQDVSVYKGAYFSAARVEETNSIQSLEEELARRGIGKFVNVNSTKPNWNWQYSIYLGEKISDDDMKIVTSQMQNFIDNEYRNLTWILYLEILGISCLLAIFIYGLGFAISWVVNGFALKKKES